MLAEFNETIQQWIAFLDDYSFETLLRKPRPGAWSMGQMYLHLLVSTEFFIEQAKNAAATDQHHDKSMHEDAKRMFANNSFPRKIHCISIENGDITTIGYARSGMGKYFYKLFDKDLTPDQQKEYNNGRTYI